MHQPHAPRFSRNFVALIQARGMFEGGEGLVSKKDGRAGTALGDCQAAGKVVDLRVQ